MFRRLTALGLSLCIALPVCWCSVTRAAIQESADCCAAEPADSGDGCADHHEGSPTCPCCSLHKEKRELAQRLSLSKPAQRLPMILAGWSDDVALPGLKSPRVSEAPARERAPPGVPEALYLRHRALLL